MKWEESARDARIARLRPLKNKKAGEVSRFRGAVIYGDKYTQNERGRQADAQRINGSV